jgi:ketosteroid isomerase-like protein
MSQENVDLVVRANAAANRGDDAEAAAAWHPDAELGDLAHAVDTEPMVKGRDAVLALWSQWRETFDEFRAEIEETVDCGTHVVCATRWVGRAAQVASRWTCPRSTCTRSATGRSFGRRSPIPIRPPQ